jgi:hypothetical protein
MAANSEYLKAAMAWNTDSSGSDMQSNNALDGNTSELGSLSNSKDYTSAATVTDAVIPYVTASGPNSPEPATTSSGSHLNFSTSTLLEAMPAPTSNTPYSNFRNYNLPTSSSTEAANIPPVLTSDSPHSNIYTYSVENGPKRDSFGEMAGESTLVSGKPYSPLDHPPPQNTAVYSALRRDEFNRNAPTNPSSISSLNRSY